nr:MAG TPA_asm: hypothetical protein [Caudoviricetes sp.]
MEICVKMKGFNLNEINFHTPDMGHKTKRI